MLSEDKTCTASNSPVTFVMHLCFAVLLCKLANTCLKHVRQIKATNCP